MPIIRPQDYYYLYSPWWSDPAEMLKYTMQTLCVEGHIAISYRKIFTSANAKYPRVRTFLKLGKNFDPKHHYTKAEYLIVSKLTDEEIRLTTFYFRVMDEINHQIQRFKTQYVFDSVQKNGWCFSPRFLNRSGRLLQKQMADLMDDIDNSVEDLVKDPALLQEKLKEIGSNYIFLNEDSLSAFNLKVYQLREVLALFVPHNFYTESGISFGTNIGSGGGHGGGFGGFGGGNFGGGGSGGDW